MSLSSEQLSQLAIAAQQHPPGSLGRQTALRQLVDGIMRSKKLSYPQQGQFAGRYREIYDEAVQDLLLYICQNIQTYDSNRGSVLAWANMLLERRFFRQAIPKVLGKPALQCVSLDALEGMAAPQVAPSLTEVIKECIETDVKDLFKREYLQSDPAINFQTLVLKRLAGQSWDVIAAECGIKKGTISSFYSRCLKKFSNQLREYCIEQNY
ncbi:MAG: hypothetical protein OHK0047_38320 [Leptolyngbyaceae cyanobacterium]